MYLFQIPTQTSYEIKSTFLIYLEPHDQKTNFLYYNHCESLYDKDHKLHIILSYNRYKLNSQLTCTRGGFIAQSVEHCTGITEVMGSDPIGASEYFLGFLCNCLSYFTTAKITFTSIIIIVIFSLRLVESKGFSIRI